LSSQSGEDIRQRLEEVFRRIRAERMRNMPLLHSVLEVEAVGFRRSGSARIGVLITPWSMNLLRLPDADPIPPGQKGSRDLPRGPVDFVGAWEPGIGPYETCSLFSPMFRFADQAAARAVAFEVLALLLQPGPDLRPGEPKRRGGGPIAALRRNADQNFDRRGFLRGAFLDDDGDSR
jgi:[NiFe] hydrogenase assembly HybE family chaperone